MHSSDPKFQMRVDKSLAWPMGVVPKLSMEGSARKSQGGGSIPSPSKVISMGSPGLLDKTKRLAWS